MNATTTPSDIITRLESHIASECKAIDQEERYEEMLREVYGNSVNVCGMDMDPVRVLKEMDPTAFRCGVNDWADGEDFVEIGSETYLRDDAQEAVDSFLSDLQDEFSSLEGDLEDVTDNRADGELDEDEMREAEILRAKIEAKQAEIDAVEAYSL